MATHPRNSLLTDLQWDLALRESSALRFIDFVDFKFPGIINEHGNAVSVKALDALFGLWKEADAKRERFDASLIPAYFALARTTTLNPANKASTFFLFKRAQAHQNS